MLLYNSKIVLLIVVITCCLALHAATALVQHGRMSRIMQQPAQSESESETVAATKVNTTIMAKEENAADEHVDNNNDNDDGNDDAKSDAIDDQNDNTEVKTELQAGTASNSLSIWSTVRDLWSLVRDGLSESFLERSGILDSRTFGKIRRLKMLLIPLIFKMGLLVAMVGFLLLLAMKTIVMLKVLLLINAIGLLAKFFTLKLKLAQNAPEPSLGHANWNYEPISHGGGWSTDDAVDSHAPSKEIHLHIHGGQLQQQGYAQQVSYGNNLLHASQGWDRRNDPYVGYATYAPSSQNTNTLSSEQLTNSGLYKYVPIN